MVSVNLKSLVGKLNETCRRSLESAAGLCLSRTNYNVEIEHWLLKLLETHNTDLAALLRHFEIDASRVVRATDGIHRPLEDGQRPAPGVVAAGRGPDPRSLGDRLGRVRHSAGSLRALAVCAVDGRNAGPRRPRGFGRTPEDLDRRAVPGSAAVVAKTDEAGQAAAAEAVAGTATPAPGKPLGPTKTPALDQFTIDLTARARQGDIDPVLGRDPEIRQIIDILTRRRQNNPILTGEAGVGKTAVVEGFALRIAAGDVPPSLHNVALRTLDLGLLQAGAGIKGEFENRLKSVIDEVKASPTPIILFIDEAHTMIGAGGQAGGSDAANLLKPALARGELRTIAATTWAEYKKYFEKDAALARRFQVVKVEEPDEKAASK